MLVVDDDPRSRRLLEGYLRAEGHRVQSAPDGPAALEMARREPPDVVLLDVMMPMMTGYEVCEALKQAPATRLCQVMLVTALDSTPDKVEGLDTGADDHVAKPVRREEFLAKVRALLRARGLLLELEQARAALAERNEELQLKKTLAQTLVHDLKNPLSAILGNLDLLEMRADESLRQMIVRSKQGARRMLKMILNLLDVEALEQGRLAPTLDRLDAAGVAAATIEEAEAAAGQKEIRLVLEAPAEAWTLADPVLIRRVVDNLLSNSVNHSPTGGTITVRVAEREEGVEISVADEGPGIPEAYRERVFEKYAQLDLRRSGLSTNRGLGLTFCRLAVEAHGGTLWAEEAEGGGALFRVLLPAAEAAQPARPVEVGAST
jgi:signal transduction histidine kinase